MSPRPTQVVSAQYLVTAVEPKGYPRPSAPEVAFVGRSNVGKSSMINALCGRRKLVRVSNTPGRTRTVNFFDVTLVDGQGLRRALRFCDLPGYGFARASKAERNDYRRMVETYLRTRERLCAVVCIVDANVGPTEDDLSVVPWLAAAGRSVLVVATKIDRVPKHRRLPRAREIEKALGLPAGGVLGVSATERMELEALWDRILQMCPPLS